MVLIDNKFFSFTGGILKACKFHIHIIIIFNGILAIDEIDRVSKYFIDICANITNAII